MSTPAMLKRLQSIFATCVTLIVWAACFDAIAGECAVNLLKEGNFLTGTSFKATVDLPSTSQDAAWQAAHNHIARDGWIIQQADKKAGLIAAQSARATRPTPLNVLVEASESGSKLSIAYTTPGGSASPEGAVRTAFCDLAAAASAGSSGSTGTPAPKSSQAASVSPRTAVVSENTPSASPVTKGSPYVKGGLPCFLEICVGDGLDAIKKVKWLPVQPDTLRVGPAKRMLRAPSESLAPYDTRLVSSTKSNWQGDISRIFRYLHQGSFDTDALPYLEGITTSCTPNVLYGVYVTPAGNQTAVSIALRYPSSDSAAQRWVITSLDRSIAYSGSINESQQIREQLAERYDGLMLLHASTAGAAARAPHGTGQVNWLGSGLVLSVVDRVNSEDKILSHPYCGGGRKPKLD